MRFVIACLSAASVCAAAVFLQAAPAAAADLPTAPSSYPALGSGGADAAPDYWSGLSVSAGVSVWGGKGVKGGVGGETDLNYEHVFDNGIMLGVQASTGYMPYSANGPRILAVHGRRFRRRFGHRRVQFWPGDARTLSPGSISSARRASAAALSTQATRSTPSSPDPAQCRRSARLASASTIASPRISAWGSKRSCTPAPVAARFRHGRSRPASSSSNVARRPTPIAKA